MFSVYFQSEKRAGDVRYAEDAAAFVAFLGDGAEIRYRNVVVWTEGKEDVSAAESYDHVAEVVDGRVRTIYREANAEAP